MQSRNILQSMTRRTFGKVVASAVAALSHVTGGSAHSPLPGSLTFTVYSFYPMERGGLTKCRACLSHAEHKRFATREAAEANRAHAGCDCGLLMTAVSEEDYLRMFGGSAGAPDREIFDLRWQDGA